MHIITATPIRNTATPQQPKTEGPKTDEPQDSWQESAFGQAALTIGRNVGLSGGLAAAGALGAQAGPLGVLGTVGGAAALGAWLSKDTTFSDDLSPKQNVAMGASLAAAAALIGVVPSQVGGLSSGLLAAGILGGMGLFRGLLEVAAIHNQI